ncbi:competence type IV pilus major pilin ComGC [Alkalibacter saccharofermentans]|uniref:General secretion pathway protein G n=1 Tax=Alkalibacter saccharofermentans DSM 14828 TaxID=1120975 RepID=A0A1M4S898_9FIRM|nr:prepilin-type N-terminal cleavage/methylation domain-containing protein [Alkalibacter saccharofermentans]SHE28422.1 general secretion pathway protein G [Alkalibacter saccharofermentans DSM 14828]
MLKLRKMLKRNRKGFTLIELIVVLAILAIIALLAVPRFLTTLEAARVSTDEANARTLESAVQLYYAEHLEYPDSLDDLVSDYIDVVPATQSETYTGFALQANGKVVPE